MQVFTLKALAAFITLWPTAIAVADSEVSLESVIEKALLRSPEVAALNEKSAFRIADGIALKTFENPELEGEFRFPVSKDGSSAKNEIAVSLAQPLRASDFGLRGKINSLIQSADSTEKALELLEFTQAVRLAYVRVWALSQLEEQLERISRQSTRLEKLVAKGAKAGLFGKGEELLFEAEALKLANQQQGIEIELKQARSELIRKVGFSIHGRFTSPPLYSIPAETQNRRLPQKERIHALLRLRKEQEKLAKSSTNLRFTPRLVYERNSEGIDYLGVGVSVPLPFWDRNQAEQIRSRTETKTAESQLAYYEGAAFEHELKLYEEVFSKGLEQLHHYRNKVLPTIHKALAAQESLLQSGQGSIAPLWQALRDSADAEKELLNLRLKVESDRAAVVILRGLEF